MRYYVYYLIDPRCGSVYYVGKGCGNRCEQHLRDAKRGKQGATRDRIREILEAGGEYQWKIAKYFDTEEDAYAYEVRQIEKLGLDNLTNVTPGGGAPRDCMVGYWRSLCRFAVKTNGFKTAAMFRFCGEWHDVPHSLVAKASEEFKRVIEIKGLKWCNANANGWLKISKVEGV